ncbi:MAG: signal peptide peptidase SppA [Byssovorax sp.]
MPRKHLSPASIETAIRALRAGAQNALSHLPGERPSKVVVEISGPIARRAARPSFFGLPFLSRRFQGAIEIEHIKELLDALAGAPWIHEVALRLDDIHADPSVLYALRRAIEALGRAGKRTRALLCRLTWGSYYLATAAREIIVPESADIELYGLGVTVTFMRDALARFGVRFEKLAIDEYKNAFDELVRQEMSPAQREQLDALLDRIEAHYLGAMGEGRGLSPAEIRGFFDEGVGSAERALERKLIDRVAYEDEILDAGYTKVDDVLRHLRAPVPSPLSARVAVVSLLGAIIPGKSRRAPLPLPGFGGHTAGAETLIQALRAADQDSTTAAIVLFVDSGGGSALASDLIGREVKRIAAKKPVVAVMGAVAASGGYYVLTHASRVIAAPSTVTGSIGVLTGKLVLEELLARHGFHTEQLRRGRYALLFDPSTGLGDDERALLARSNEEIYQRFLRRVAEGRKLTVEQVHAVARGRIWAGSEAMEKGLVDELGDLETGIERARALAGLGSGAPVWHVHAPEDTALPHGGDAEALLHFLSPLAREHSLLLEPRTLRFG